MRKFLRLIGLLLGLLVFVPDDAIPPSAWIAFVSHRGGSQDLYRVRADGSGLQRLTTNPGFDGYLQWSPDGRWIVFESVFVGDSEVYRVQLDGINQQNLTNRPGTDRYPKWSPDGGGLHSHPIRMVILKSISCRRMEAISSA